VKTHHLPRTSGIYQILNEKNGKVYIGSAVDLQRRAHHHRRELRRGTHGNPKLQRAWNKHGEDAFAVSVLELVPYKEDLIVAEQYWIDGKQAVVKGYNLAPKAGSQLGFKYSAASLALASKIRKKPRQGFITPEGYPLTILDVLTFCAEHGLIPTLMYNLALGKGTTHKGWLHENAKPKEREWIKTFEGFVNPEGVPVGPITNLEAFCSEHGLIPSNMHKVYRGEKLSHRGWRHQSTLHMKRKHVGAPPQTYPGWVSPGGEDVTIVNLRRFCEVHGLDQPSMWKVMQGKYPQHKGWRYPAGGYEPKRRQTLTWRGFVSPEGEQVVIENLNSFCLERGLNSGHMSRVRLGKRKSHKGWTYRPELETT
jgi:group I intron endonuclease